MKKLSIVLVGIIGSALFVASCAKNTSDTSYLYIPTVSDTTATASLLDLQKGRELFINNCGACHAYPTPENYSPSQWVNIMDRMAPKTSMSSTQVQLVLKYVTKGQ